jgi:UDP-glucose 4-epimerase
MKILVSGGAGFIGSNLVDKLIKDGHQVVVIDNLFTGKKENLNPKAKFYKIDIQNPKISQIFKKEKPEVVFHLAAQVDLRKSVENPIESAKVNILGSLNILENCQKFKIKKIIFSSTGGAIYGEAKIIPTPEDYPANPLSPYGIEKLTIEKYLDYYWKIFKISYISLRLANVYGPRQNSKGEAGVIAIFCDKMLCGKQPIIYGLGCQTRDFVFVDDVAEANILAMKSKKVGIFNIGTGKETDIDTVFEKIKKLIGVKCKKIHAPAQLGEQKRSCLNYTKAKKELGWQPKYSLENGLKETINYFKNGN